MFAQCCSVPYIHIGACHLAQCIHCPSHARDCSQVFESLCLVLLALRGETGSACILIAGGMGTLVLLSRAFLTHGSWARLLAAFRAPRYMAYALHKLTGAAGWPMVRPELLWGLSEAIYDGVLLPLCCPVSFFCFLHSIYLEGGWLDTVPPGPDMRSLATSLPVLPTAHINFAPLYADGSLPLPCSCPLAWRCRCWSPTRRR